MKIFYTILLICLITSKINSETFTSIASGDWNTGGVAVWSVSPATDGDNIPDAGDDVIIASTHTISVTSNANGRSLTINFGGTYTGNNNNLLLKANFTNNGTATGIRFNFSFANSTITSSTPLTVFRFLAAGSTVSLSLTTQMTLTSTFNLHNAAIFNNNGTLILNASLLNGSTTTQPIFNNLGTGVLSLGSNVTVPTTLNSSANSTINLLKSVTSIPNNWTYHHLNLQGSVSTKAASATLNVNGNLTVNAGVICNLASNTLNLKGNLSNSGTISNLNTVNLNGTANQTLTSTSALTIPILNSTNTTTILVNSGTYNIGTSASFTGSLNLNAIGVILNLNSHPFTIGGNLTNIGTISNPAAVTFNGGSGAAQTISFTNNLTFTDMTSSNPLGVSITTGTHSITNSLTVSSGNLNVGANLITLVSDIAKTAYIANSAGTMSGSMIVQRYVPAGVEAYHDFGTSVASTTIDDWDNELYMTIGAANNVAGYPGGDGMLTQEPTFYSVTTYNEGTDAYDDVTTGTTLSVGKGYSVWVADDQTSFPGRAIDSRGTPNMGTITVVGKKSGTNPGGFDGWNLISNPHAAFIDWGDVVTASSNLQTYIQIYDGSGNYVDDLTQPDIAPGQGFFCEVMANNTNINFPQSSKRTTTSSSFMRSSNVKNHDLKLRLSSNTNSYFHEININYDADANLGYEQGKDIPFIKSPKQTAPYITFTDGTHKFIRNKMNTASSLVVLPLEISTPIAGNYTIELEGLLSNGVYSEAYFINNITKEKIEIGDANAITMYFEKGEIITSYSLVLKKTNVPFNFIGDNISIFSTADLINIKGNFETAQTVKVEVYNIVGQLVMNTTTELLPNDRITLSTADLQSEVYVVKVTTSNNQQFTNKIVVTK